MTDHPGVRLDARAIPFPTSISAEAQAVLRRLVGEDGIPLNALQPMPAFDDLAGWTALKARVELYYAAAAGDQAARLKSSAETIEAGTASIHVATPAEPAWPDHVYIDLHGGALVFGGGAACRVAAQTQADRHGMLCYGVDYRMPPEHPYPAALDDCMAAYRHALDCHAPANIIVGGRSAGGKLAVAMMLRARDVGLPLPAALVLLSPEVDLTESGDSFAVNRMVDVMLPGSLMAANLLYAKGADLTDPYLSPLFGDLAGFPPTFLQSGTRDLFLSNTVRMHRRLRRASIAAELHIFEAMPHGGFMGAAPEDDELAGEVARFVREIWSGTGRTR